MSDFGTPQFPPPQFPTARPPVPPGRSGPPWEQTGPAVQRFIDTAKGVLTDPSTTFSNMRREGGIPPPLLYFLIGMLIGVVGSSLWQFIGFGGMPGGFGGGSAFGGAAAASVGIGMALIVGPILATCGLFLGTLIIHFALGLFGGQKYPFETTFRTVAYSFGSAYPIAILPFCGGIIAGIWGIVSAIVGLSQTQETTMGKSAAAVLTPTVLCCALWFFFAAAMVMLIMGGAAAGSFGR